MKTTVDIPESLLTQLRKTAQRENTTVKAVIHAALRRYLASGGPSKKATTPRDCTYGSGGLQPGIEEGNWSQIRDIIYEGRGA